MNPAAPPAAPIAPRHPASATVPPPAARMSSLSESDSTGQAAFSRLLGLARQGGPGGPSSISDGAGAAAMALPSPGATPPAPAPSATADPRPSSEAERARAAGTRNDDAPPPRRPEPGRDRAASEGATRRVVRGDGSPRSPAAGTPAQRTERTEGESAAAAARLDERGDTRDGQIAEAAADEAQLVAAEPALPALLPDGRIAGHGGVAGGAIGRKTGSNGLATDESEPQRIAARGPRLLQGMHDRTGGALDPTRREGALDADSALTDSARAPARQLAAGREGAESLASAGAATALAAFGTGTRSIATGTAVDGASPLQNTFNASAAAGLASAAALGGSAVNMPGASGASSASGAEGRLAAAPGSEAFARELGTQVTVWVRDGVQQARLQLHPLELGPVQVRIQFDAQANPAAQALSQAQVQVQLAADLPATRQALEQALPSLASQLSDAGFTLAGGGVFERPGGGPADHGSASDGAAAAERQNVESDAAGRDPVLSRLDDTAAAMARGNARLRGLVDLFA